MTRSTKNRYIPAVLAIALIFCITPVRSLAGGESPHIPTIDELLEFKTVSEAKISPDGAWVAYLMRETNFKKDAFTAHIWLAEVASGNNIQLTRGESSCTAPRWSPDGKWLAFLSGRIGKKSQVFAIHPAGGEAIQLTSAETGISSFQWSPDGKMIAFLATDPVSPALKGREEYWGDYEVAGREHSFVHVWTVDVETAMISPHAGQRQTGGESFSVNSFSWSPDGVKIAFSATITPELKRENTEDLYVVNLADHSVKKIVSQPGIDSNPLWSPDGKRILFNSFMGRLNYFAMNSRLALVPAEGGVIRSISDGFDEIPMIVAWNQEGIYFNAYQKTSFHLFRIDPADQRIERVTIPDDFMGESGGESFTFSRDGTLVAFIAKSPVSFPEVSVSGFPFRPRALTDMTKQAHQLLLGTREVVSWKSKDGTEIEGILIKPRDFDPSKKHPLLCVLHGGPTGIDLPDLFDRAYPVDIWAARGALILKVNYRGSAGYGEKFRLLNTRNLGVGDAWDVISGVDALIKKGWVDPDRVGCMGWSQGGFISAFLSTSSDRFRAFSVGAGISNWATNYYNSDLTPFTVFYLGANPTDDPEIYRKTSPISYVKKAGTPTLIQHGELDDRVPIANAHELRQALEDRGVPVELIVYKGFGHGITKPKARRARLEHNLLWFNHHIFGDPKPDFLKAPVPPAGL